MRHDKAVLTGGRPHVPCPGASRARAAPTARMR